MDATLKVKFIKDQGYRVVNHDDRSCTIYVLVKGGNEIPYHVKSIEQARSALGY